MAKVKLAQVSDVPEGGLTMPSTVLCDQIRTIETARLIRRMGLLSGTMMTEIGARLRRLLELL